MRGRGGGDRRIQNERERGREERRKGRSDTHQNKSQQQQFLQFSMSFIF